MSGTAGGVLPRLSAATLGGVTGTCTPAFDRSQAPTIVHLGVGAFARAHLAAYAHELLERGHPAMVHGVSLRSPRSEHELAPQDGLYSLTIREPGAPSRTCVIGSLGRVSTGLAAAVEAIADPAVRLVTLTVTEKGYEKVGADSVPAVLAAALDRRRRSSGSSVVVASLDNLLDNGALLRGRVREAAAALVGRNLVEWIDGAVAFPGSVVDRMVPATTPADRAEVADRLGLDDAAAVVAEAHRSWVIERVDGLPPLHEVGVEVVDDIGPAQQRKLWLLNGPHSAAAYGGWLAGHATIAEALADPVVAAFVHAYAADAVEVVPAADEPAAYAAAALRRFANAALGHTCVQVAADGSRKLLQRVLPVMARRRRLGLDTERGALVLAAWLAAVTRTPLAGRERPAVDDPAAAELGPALRDGGVARALALAFGPDHDVDVAEVRRAFDRLTRHGLDALGATS